MDGPGGWHSQREVCRTGPNPIRKKCGVGSHQVFFFFCCCCYTIQPYKVVNASLSRSTYHTHNPGSFHRSFTVGCLRDRTVNARRHSGGFGSSDAPAPDFLETRNSVSSSLQSTRARPRWDSNPRPLSGGVGVRVGQLCQGCAPPQPLTDWIVTPPANVDRMCQGKMGKRR